ncbi:sensor histidine kinase [Hyphococcus sp.]|uniref:sensor histidine kinase n=1 Tax=Hyphococcus sp. TaxID=2038636 RepID=UPI003D0D7B92
MFGIACTLLVIGARALVDSMALSAGPFSLIYPAILIATLFGRWQAGLVAWGVSLLYAWYFVLPAPGSFAFDVAGDAARTMVNAGASLVIVVFAEIFRRAVREAAAERDKEIKERGLLLREIDHRMRNNFAIVESFLNLQVRTAESDEAKRALAIAAGRMHSFAAAHKTLYREYRGADGASLIDMRTYLADITAHLAQALFPSEQVKLHLDVGETQMPRDKAAAIGLVLNELVTNAAKHAFHGRDDGELAISFDEDGGEWRLTVADNGCGIENGRMDNGHAKGEDAREKLGAALVEAFAQKAGGVISQESNGAGARFVVTGRVH